jgi:hypothetical protein
MTEDLYTTADVKRIRELLLKEQQGVDLLTGLPIPDKQAATDHVHDNTQLVRGILHRQSNAVLGKLENLWTRYLSWWYPEDLPTFLRKAADYIQRKPDTRYRHPDWIKLAKARFNRLNSKEMKSVLEGLGRQDGKNLTERKKIFQEIVLDRKLGYEIIISEINKVKEL